VTDYGDVWRQSDVKLWGDMWAQHKGSLMTEAVIEEAMKSQRLIEVGCGAGHMLRELLKRGWKGQYQGFDIGSKATTAMSDWLFTVEEMEVWDLVPMDFIEAVTRGPAMIDEADLLVARGVVQHHAHWSILPQVAFRFVPKVVLGIGYTTERTDRHTGGWEKKGCYDVRVSPELLKVEATALGMRIERCEILPRGKRRELLVVLTKGES